MTIIFNPITGAPISDIFAQKVFKIAVNTMVRFDQDQVAKYLLDKYAFLRKVDTASIVSVQKQIEKATKEELKTPEQVQEEAMAALTPEQRKVLESVPAAQPSGEIRVVNKKQRVVTPEEAEGIPPSGTKDKDGVAWVGEGLESDNLASMKTVIPGKDPGVF